MGAASINDASARWGTEAVPAQEDTQPGCRTQYRRVTTLRAGSSALSKGEDQPNEREHHERALQCTAEALAALVLVAHNGQ